MAFSSRNINTPHWLSSWQRSLTQSPFFHDTQIAKPIRNMSLPSTSSKIHGLDVFSIPAETKLEIFSYLDLTDMNAIISASPTMLRCFKTNEQRILERIQDWNRWLLPKPIQHFSCLPCWSSVSHTRTSLPRHARSGWNTGSTYARWYQETELYQRMGWAKVDTYPVGFGPELGAAH